MISKFLFYVILAVYISSFWLEIYFFWFSDSKTLFSLVVSFCLLFVFVVSRADLALTEGKLNEKADRTIWGYMLVFVTFLTLLINVCHFFSIKNNCNFDYTTTFKVYSLGWEDSAKVRNVCEEEKEKAETVSLVNFVWEIDKIKGCTIPNKKREIIYDIQHLSKEEFDTDFESHKEFLLNVIEDCKADIIRNNLLKDKTYNSNVDDYLKQINEFKTKIENITN